MEAFICTHKIAVSKLTIHDIKINRLEVNKAIYKPI